MVGSSMNNDSEHSTNSIKIPLEFLTIKPGFLNIPLSYLVMDWIKMAPQRLIHLNTYSPEGATL